MGMNNIWSYIRQLLFEYALRAAAERRSDGIGEDAGRAA